MRLPLSPPASKRKQAVSPSTVTCSTQVPAHFNPTWFQKATIPLEVDLAAHHVELSADGRATDFHFVRQCLKQNRIYYGLIDCSHGDGEHGEDCDGEAMIKHLEEAVMCKNMALSCSDTRIVDTRHVIISSIEQFATRARVSAIVVEIDLDTNVLRLTQLGTCALMVIRDDNIIYRSYPNPNNALSLINHLCHQPDQHDHSEVHSEFIELSPNDLVITGSDGFFSNLSDPQILAFVRPVPDHIDKTLALANNTCLASWTSDDVEFISYYLANLATNFATAQHSKSIIRYPFPPSPHLDDITVLCASCSFG